MKKILSRYEVIDSYLLAEIEYEYLNADNHKKIELLANIYCSDAESRYLIPYELALKFIEHADNYVLLWFAKNAKNLDYRESSYNKGITEYKYPDRNLLDLLTNHHDEAIKCAAYENEDNTIHRLSFEKSLRNSEHKYLLAQVRNTNSSCVDLLYITIKLFDKSADYTFISDNNLNEIRRAILTNNTLLKYTHDIANDPDYYSREIRDLGGLWFSIYDCSDFKSKEIAFRYLGGIDGTKAAIYQKLLDSLEDDDNDKPLANSTNDSLRFAIFNNTTIKDAKTLELAKNDSAFYISYNANKKYVPAEDISVKGYIKKYYLNVLNELASILAIVFIISNISNTYIMSIMCVLIYTYLVLYYKSKSIMIMSMSENILVLRSISLNSQGEPKEDIDKIIASNSGVLQSEITKQFISASGISIISLYIGYKIISELL